jgi:hypothetical protein
MRAQRDAGESYQEKGTTSEELPQSKYSLLKSFPFDTSLSPSSSDISMAGSF